MTWTSSAAYHEDGIDEYGKAINPGPAYGNWANATHAATSQTHSHNTTTHTCEIDGDTAHAESYVIVVLLGREGRSAHFESGRYPDPLERQHGQWRIAVRRSTVDGRRSTVEVMFLTDASVLQSSFTKDTGYRSATVITATCPTNAR